MPNRLARESSPYLLQHQNNPVDWYPWGEEALQKAKSEDKPIFLSIGYAACHWCHVMEHESFEDEQTAALMNEFFINIKVDREERPDLDTIYMQAVVAMTRQGGWPMSVFLTPDGEPFYGGTYYPPVPRYQMPSFRQVLSAVADAWQQDRENVRGQAGRLSEHLRQELGGLPATEGRYTLPDLEAAAQALEDNYDWVHGGWGKAPKFPQPMAIEFLLRQATRGNASSLRAAAHALDAMAQGGMYDVVGGGFARYSVDDVWLVPHFEKMLYDNAQLARVYLYAWLLTKKPLYRKVVEETLDFVMREMTSPTGGFYSSLDADSEGVEGKFYVWTQDEIEETLTDPDDRILATLAYGLTEHGNFEGNTVLQRKLDDSEIAQAMRISLNEVAERLDRVHAQLLERRSERVRPGTDDKCVVAWNGLMLLTFSEATKYLDKDKYKYMAMRNAKYLMDSGRETVSKRLLRTVRDDVPGPAGYLEDYAAVGLGLLALYEADPDPNWFAEAKQITDQMIRLFHTDNEGFFDTGIDQEALIVRPKNLQDNATPCGSSLAADLLLKIHAYTGDGQYRDLAEQALSPIPNLSNRYPAAFANWLCAADKAIGPLREVVLVGDHGGKMDTALWSSFRPRLIAASVTDPAAPNTPPVAQNRPALDGKPTAYICEGFVCLQPLTDTREFLQQLQPTD